jgi:hypothetical protein
VEGLEEGRSGDEDFVILRSFLSWFWPLTAAFMVELLSVGSWWKESVIEVEIEERFGRPSSEKDMAR